MVNYDSLNNMCEWEQEKALYLIKRAKELGMDTTGYGELAVNPNSGYTYLWLEDYSFSLYMPINCDLVNKDVVALWTNPENGEDQELVEFESLEEVENWVDELIKEAQ